MSGLESFASLYAEFDHALADPEAAQRRILRRLLRLLEEADGQGLPLVTGDQLSPRTFEHERNGRTNV